MKKMAVCLLVLLAGMALGGWLMWRRQTRLPAPAGIKPADAWQGSIKVDRGGAYTPDEATQQRLREKLQAEEKRQRPQEGRN